MTWLVHARSHDPVNPVHEVTWPNQLGQMYVKWHGPVTQYMWGHLTQFTQYMWSHDPINPMYVRSHDLVTQYMTQLTKCMSGHMT